MRKPSLKKRCEAHFTKLGIDADTMKEAVSACTALAKRKKKLKELKAKCTALCVHFTTVKLPTVEEAQELLTERLELREEARLVTQFKASYNRIYLHLMDVLKKNKKKAKKTTKKKV